MDFDFSIDKIKLTLPEMLRLLALGIIIGGFYVKVNTMAENSEITAMSLQEIKRNHIILSSNLDHLEKDVLEIKTNDKRQDKQITELKFWNTK